jgi:aromatic-L-amino-acid/L-tryptophan decarboxylase
MPNESAASAANVTTAAPTSTAAVASSVVASPVGAPHGPELRVAAGDVAAADFERASSRALAWVRDYLAEPERFPVLSRARPGEVRAALPMSPPEEPEPLDRILDDFERVIVPGITHWNHPGFFAYFSISASGPGIIGELLASALNVNGMLWKTSPAATELEQLSLDWLRQMLGLGEGWFGMIADTASISTLLAIAAARESRPALAVRELGLAGRPELPTMRVYCSEHAHSSVDKAAITLGLGHRNVIRVPCDAEFRMRPDALRRQIEADVLLGYLPLACVATVGTTSTTSIDPVPEILEVCRAHNVWLHVDGAYGGVAGLVPEMREYLAGVDGADSLVVNPHKWLFTPVDCSAFYTRRPEALKRAFSLVPEYLVTAEGSSGSDAPVDYMDYGVQLGRRFRALKLWMVIRAFGATGLAERIRHHCALARELAYRVEEEPGWALCAPVPFSLICFRYAPEGSSEEQRNAMNAAILSRVNATGEAYLSHTKLDGSYVLRLAIGNVRTEWKHVERAWELLREAAASVMPDPANAR